MQSILEQRLPQCLPHLALACLPHLALAGARALPPGKTHQSLDTPRKRIKGWQDETRAQLRKLVSSPVRGTFAADADRYLAAVKGMAGIDERRKLIAAWVGIFGHRYRERIAAVEIRAQLEEWRVEREWSASTLNHYRGALMHLWHVLDGKAERNPVRDVPRYGRGEEEARGLPYRVVRAILEAMPPSLTRLRLAIIAFTGLPHATLMRLGPEKIDWQAGTFRRPRRRKGQGTAEKVMPLSRRALYYFKLLDRAGGWGPFSTSSMRMSFLRACRAAERAAARQGERLDLSGVRPYDLRHSFGTAVQAATGDLQATRELLDHASLSTTLRYTRGSVAPAVVEAQAKTEKLLAQKSGTRMRRNGESQTTDTPSTT